MKFLKWLIFSVSVITLIFYPIGMFMDLFFAKIVGAISLLCQSILWLILAILTYKEKKKRKEEKKTESSMTS